MVWTEYLKNTLRIVIIHEWIWENYYYYYYLVLKKIISVHIYTTVQITILSCFFFPSFSCQPSFYMHKWGTCQAEIKISWIETAFRLWRSIRHLGCLWMLTDILLNSQPFLDKLKCCFVTQQSTVISSNSYSFHCHKTVCLCTRKIIQNSVHILNFLEKKLKLEYWTVVVKTQEDYTNKIGMLSSKIDFSKIQQKYSLSNLLPLLLLVPLFFLAKYLKIRGRGEDELTSNILTSCEPMVKMSAALSYWTLWFLYGTSPFTASTNIKFCKMMHEPSFIQDYPLFHLWSHSNRELQLL